MVWYFYPPKKRKLCSGWSGPFKVEGKYADYVYRIQPTNGWRSRVVHVDHLRPYFSDEETHPKDVVDDESSEGDAEMDDHEIIDDHECGGRNVDMGNESADIDMTQMSSDQGRARRRPAYLDEYYVPY